MMMSALAGLSAVIPATIFLAVSFFVLVVARKSDSPALKSFGYIVAALLWVSALLVFSTGIYSISIGRRQMMYRQTMMGGTMPGMMQGKRPMTPPPGNMPMMQNKGQMMQSPASNQTVQH